MTKILTKEEIGNIESVSNEAVDKYLNLAKERLVDSNDISKQLEAKVFNIFKAYSVTALVLFGLSEKIPELSLCFVLSGTLLFFGIVSLFFALRSSECGMLGRHPECWFDGDKYLTASKDDLSKISAYILYDYMVRIDQSISSNSKRAKLLDISIIFGITALLPFVLKSLFSL